MVLFHEQNLDRSNNIFGYFKNIFVFSESFCLLKFSLIKHRSELTLALGLFNIITLVIWVVFSTTVMKFRDSQVVNL